MCLDVWNAYYCQYGITKYIHLREPLSFLFRSELTPMPEAFHCHYCVTSDWCHFYRSMLFLALSKKSETSMTASILKQNLTIPSTASPAVLSFGWTPSTTMALSASPPSPSWAGDFLPGVAAPVLRCSSPLSSSSVGSMLIMRSRNCTMDDRNQHWQIWLARWPTFLILSSHTIIIIQI